MDAIFKEVRDPKTHRLLGIYYQEDGTYESMLKGRVMQMQFQPGTLVEFSFTDVKPVS